MTRSVQATKASIDVMKVGTAPTYRTARAASDAGDRLDVVFRTVRAGNLFDETVKRLIEAVTLGAVGPGERLPSERELVDRLGVSRATLREALRSLAEAGYLEARRGRNGGTFVRPRPTPASGRAARAIARRMGPDLADALAYRAALEPAAAALAATRATHSDMDLLRGHLARMTDLKRDAYRAADQMFHVRIAELSGSPSIAHGVAEVQVRLSDALAAVPLVDGALRRANISEHDEITAAIEAGDSSGARRCMEEHLGSTEALLRGLLD